MKEAPSNQEKVRFEIKRPPWNSETKKPEKTPAHGKKDQEKMQALRVELAGMPVLALIMAPPIEKPPKDKPETIPEMIFDLILTIFEKLVTKGGEKNVRFSNFLQGSIG